MSIFHGGCKLSINIMDTFFFTSSDKGLEMVEKVCSSDKACVQSNFLVTSAALVCQSVHALKPQLLEQLLNLSLHNMKQTFRFQCG